MSQEVNCGMRREIIRCQRASAWAVWFVVVWSVVILWSFSESTAAAAELPRLRVVHGFGENHPVNQGIESFRERLAGKVNVEVSTWGDDREAVRAMLAGELDSAVVSPSGLRDVARAVTLLDLMGLWRDRDHWAGALDGEPGRQIRAIVERSTGVLVLGYWGGTRRHLLTRGKGVPTAETMAALRLGIPINPVQSKMWKTLGARPVFLPRAQAFSALREGTVEGIESDAETILSQRLFEVAPHLTETGHAIATRLFIISATAWQRLSRVQQAAVAVTAAEATTLARQAEVERERKASASLRDRHGVHITGFSGRDALISRTRPIRHRYADELGASRLLILIEEFARP